MAISFSFKKITRYFPAILWMGFIYYLSSHSTAGVPLEGLSRFLLMKIFHLIEYSILYVLFFYANKSAKFSIIFAFLFSLTDEFHQSFVVGRTARVTDLIFDLIGITLGFYFLKIRNIFSMRY